MPRSICKIVQSKCSYIKKWMGSCDWVKEESITDWLLYELSKSSSRIINIPFTRYEEGKWTGADWEWWILYPSRAIRLRIQAKKLGEKNITREMRRSAGENKTQMDMLIADAASPKQFPSIKALPVYVFYASDYPLKILCDGCDRGGAYLASANALKEYFSNDSYKNVSIKNFLMPLYPLSSLFCCPKMFCCFDNFAPQETYFYCGYCDNYFIGIEDVPKEIIRIADSIGGAKWTSDSNKEERWLGFNYDEEYKPLMIFDLRMEDGRNV